MLTGRKRERERLLEYYDSSKSEFVVVYGRRRVGKTYLVRETFDNSFFFYFTGSAKLKTVPEQMERFANALDEHGFTAVKKPQRWMEGFDILRDAIRASKDKGRKVIFIDEMPWLDTPKSDFLAALDYFWNSFASARKDILLIACGSAAAWITKKLFEDKGGLHNRVTGRIGLRPFSLGECEEYLAAKGIAYARYDIIECYMVFGGIPYYLDYLDPRYSLSANIDNIIFAEDAPLENEFDELYASLFENSERYTEVITALSHKMKGLTRNEIVARVRHANGGNLSEILHALELSGFIRKYQAFPHKQNGALYQLIDNFSLFWFAFIHKKRPTNPHYWSQLHNTPKLNAWRGYAFEMACLRHIGQIEQSLGISGINTHVSSWKSRSSEPGAQIDLVIERDDRVVNLCEIKYAQSEFEIKKDYADSLRNKVAAFAFETGTRKTLFLTMISTYGVKRNQYAGQVRSEVTMDALFLPQPE